LESNDVTVKSSTVTEVIIGWIDVQNVVFVDEILHCEEATAKRSNQRCYLREDADSAIDDLGECNVISHIEVP